MNENKENCIYRDFIVFTNACYFNDEFNNNDVDLICDCSLISNNQSDLIYLTG